jgi:hypothetical protein
MHLVLVLINIILLLSHIPFDVETVLIQGRRQVDRRDSNCQSPTQLRPWRLGPGFPKQKSTNNMIGRRDGYVVVHVTSILTLYYIHIYIDIDMYICISLFIYLF